MNNTSVDSYLAEGCGRCELFQTPQCKVHRWTEILVALRAMLRAAGLTEEMKWGSPCYTLAGKNVAMLVSLKESCALQFFKGAALHDPHGALDRAGPNSLAGRLLRFTALPQLIERRELVQDLLQQAIAVEQAGIKIAKPSAREPLPAELEQRLAADPELQRAFAALTPGRQRSHILHVSGAKQTETRQRRAERCVVEILAGRGFGEI